MEQQERQFRVRKPATLGPFEPGQKLAAGGQVSEEWPADGDAAVVAIGRVVGWRQRAVEDASAVAVAHQRGRHRRTPVLHTAAGVARARRQRAATLVGGTGRGRRHEAHTAREALLHTLRPVPVPEQQ